MFFQRKRGKKADRIFVYHYQDGKQRPLPRALTKHLDGKEDWEIEDWVRWYEAVHGLQPAKTFKADLADLQNLLDEYCTFLRSRGKDPNTIRIHRDRLYDVLPFFAKEPDLNQWYRLVGRLYQYLDERISTVNRHNRCNIAFRNFYKWLQLTDRVQHRHGLVLLNKGEGYKTTPLKYALLPAEVLSYAREAPCYELGIMALAGYFFSLRTFEIYALERSAFLAGSKAKGLQASLVMAKSGLYDRLLVNVTKYRNQIGEVKPCPPRKRGGIVACFNEDAAKLLVGLIKERPDGLLIKDYLPDWWGRRWADQGIPGISLKDLRRASLYWLGHNTDIPLAGLQHHARHNNPLTTARYMRRPEELFDNSELDDLDLEA